MDKLSLTGTKWQLLNGICLITSFFTCRIVWGWYQSVNIYRDIWNSLAWDSPTRTLCNNDSQEEICTSLNMSLAFIFLIANTILSCLNIFWFGLMVRALRKRLL